MLSMQTFLLDNVFKEYYNVIIDNISEVINVNEEEKNIDDIVEVLKHLDKNNLLLVSSCAKLLEARQCMVESDVKEVV